jgi:hypothetical protein
MMNTKGALAAAALALGLLSGPAAAQDAVEVTAGTEVYGPQGGLVGTVSDVAGTVATVDTGSHKVGLPLDSFGRNAEGQTVISTTQAQLNELAAKAEAEASAKLDAALVAGAPVVDVNGAPLGTVAAVEGGNVNVDTEWGAFALEKANFVPGEGQVTARVEAEQVRNALSTAPAAPAS